MPKYSTMSGFSDPNTVPLDFGALPKYRYVYFEQAVAKGEVQQWSDTPGLLGVGVEDPVAHSTRVAGVAGAALGAAGYGWLQTGGYCDYIKTDGAVDAPNADTLQGDVYLEATASETAAGLTAAELDGTAGYDHSAFAINLAEDHAVNDTGYCILCCHYQ